MAESINGWTPPVIYDERQQSARIVTQDDVDIMLRSIAVLGEFYRKTKGAVDQAKSEIAQDEFNKKMDALDAANPGPLARLKARLA